MSFQNVKIECASADPREYHLQLPNQVAIPRGDRDFAMSSSALRAFDQCPARFLKGYQPPATEAKDFGNLLDCALLTPDQFEARYAVQPLVYGSTARDPETKPWNNNATVCKEWCKYERVQGREIITTKEEVQAADCCQSLRKDEIAARFIDDSDKQVWLTGEWLDEDTKLVIPCKCLIDLVPRKDSEFCKCLGDLKTTRNAAPMAWQRWCYTAGYHIQAAWNLAMYVAATQEDRTTFCFLLVENYEPWQPAKRMLSQEFLDLGRAEINRIMALYARCLKSGNWPGYDDTDEAAAGGWSLVAPEPWMADRAMFAPRYVTGDEPEAEMEPEEVTP